MVDDYAFDGFISREVLNNYLSHAVTHVGLGMDGFTSSQTFEDDLRMLKNEGAKFIGRASYVWQTTNEEEHFRVAEKRAKRAHEVDPEFVLQACVFECIDKAYVDGVPIPAWVFEDFGLPVEKRCFSYDKMLFPDGRYVNHWRENCSVEDITQLESRMWIYYRACSYIKAGYEGIHFGQVLLIGAADEGYRYWKQVLDMVRAYAKAHARRHYVLCDAHTHGIKVDGVMLFDYNAWPIRLKEVKDRPTECIAEAGHYDSIFGRSMGGKSPSGWTAESMPFIVEYDNFGRLQPGNPVDSPCFAWGFDEITWFAMQKEEYRHYFLRYLWHWVNERYPEGWVQMPSRRGLAGSFTFVWDVPDVEWLEKAKEHEFMTYEIDEKGRAIISRRCYNANRSSDVCPFGFGDEDVIKECFANP